MTSAFVSSDRPLRVAIIGSGPSGFYAADALVKQTTWPVRVDMFDRLPTPYGLVRGGVAPDHQSIKAVIRVYEKTAASPSFRFFGNVELGRDLLVSDLEQLYDAWIYAVGSARDRRLGIPGEDLLGSHSATEFVGWYNGHPDFRDCAFDLSCERVAVVGVGNVAMDVTRILAHDPSHLASTDMTTYAVDALRESKVREVVVLGRRGVAQAAFSPAEIKEIGDLEDADLVVDPADTVVDRLSEPDLADTNVKKIVEFLAGVAARGEGDKHRKVRLRFLVSPVEVLGENGRVTAVRIERNRLEQTDRGVVAKGTGETEIIAVGMIFRSVGYHGVPIPGVPFDPKSGTVPNEAGRVLDPTTTAVLPRQYVVGWAKRGPSGLIGTNRGDSVATVNQLLADVPALSPAPQDRDVAPLLADRQVRYTTFSDWKALDKIEVERGAAAGKIREKFTRVNEMVEAIESLRHKQS